MASRVLRPLRPGLKSRVRRSLRSATPPPPPVLKQFPRFIEVRIPGEPVVRYARRGGAVTGWYQPLNDIAYPPHGTYRPDLETFAYHIAHPESYFTYITDPATLVEAGL